MLYRGAFWPFLAILWRIYALGAPFTGWNSALVPQNWQVWGMYSRNFWVAFDVSVLCHLFIPSIAYSKMARAHIELNQYLSKAFIAYQIAWFFGNCHFFKGRESVYLEKKSCLMAKHPYIQITTLSLLLLLSPLPFPPFYCQIKYAYFSLPVMRR